MSDRRRLAATRTVRASSPARPRPTDGPRPRPRSGARAGPVTTAPPAVVEAGRRLGRTAGGLILLCYGLVHLVVWPGAPTGTTGEQLRWNGASTLPAAVPETVIRTVGGLLLAVTLLGHGVGAAGLAGLPGARRHWLLATGIGAAASLALFGLAWPGLEPTPGEFGAGPVISGLLVASVLLTGWARRHPPAPPPRRG